MIIANFGVVLGLYSDVLHVLSLTASTTVDLVLKNGGGAQGEYNILIFSGFVPKLFRDCGEASCHAITPRIKQYMCS